MKIRAKLIPHGFKRYGGGLMLGLTFNYPLDIWHSVNGGQIHQHVFVVKLHVIVVTLHIAVTI